MTSSPAWRQRRRGVRRMIGRPVVDLRKSLINWFLRRYPAEPMPELVRQRIHAVADTDAILHRITAPEADGGLGLKIMGREPTDEMVSAWWGLALARIQSRMTDDTDNPGMIEGAKESCREIFDAAPATPARRRTGDA